MRMICHSAFALLSLFVVLGFATSPSRAEGDSKYSSRRAIEKGGGSLDGPKRPSMVIAIQPFGGIGEKALYESVAEAIPSTLALALAQRNDLEIILVPGSGNLNAKHFGDRRKTTFDFDYLAEVAEARYAIGGRLLAFGQGLEIRVELVDVASGERLQVPMVPIEDRRHVLIAVDRLAQSIDDVLRRETDRYGEVTPQVLIGCFEQFDRGIFSSADKIYTPGLLRVVFSESLRSLSNESPFQWLSIPVNCEDSSSTAKLIEDHQVEAVIHGRFKLAGDNILIQPKIAVRGSPSRLVREFSGHRSDYVTLIEGAAKEIELFTLGLLGADATDLRSGADILDSSAPPSELAAQAAKAMTLFEEGRAYLLARRALELDETLAEPRVVLARLFLNRSLPSRAKSELVEASKFNPSDPEILELLIDVYLGLGEFENALVSIEALIDQRRGDAYLMLEKGSILALQNRLGESVDAYRMAAAIDPDDPYVNYQLGWTLVQVGREHEGLTVLEMNLTEHPDHEMTRRLLADLYFTRAARATIGDSRHPETGSNVERIARDYWRTIALSAPSDPFWTPAILNLAESLLIAGDAFGAEDALNGFLRDSVGVAEVGKGDRTVGYLLLVTARLVQGKPAAISLDGLQKALGLGEPQGWTYAPILDWIESEESVTEDVRARIKRIHEGVRRSDLASIN